MTATRTPLPARRTHEVFDLDFEGQPFTVGIGRAPCGQILEVFIDAEKSSQMTALARDAAVLLSIALQFGVPAAALRSAVTREANGAAAGLVGAVLDILKVNAQ